MATKLTVTFHVLAELSESPNFLTCRQTCHFTEASSRLLKDENPIISSLKMTIIPSVALQG